MAKDHSLTLGSPFKFGFFAGLGFFCATVLTSVLTAAFFVALGLGTISALVGSMHKSADPAPTPPVTARPAGAVLTPAATRTRRTATERAAVDETQ